MTKWAVDGWISKQYMKHLPNKQKKNQPTSRTRERQSQKKIPLKENETQPTPNFIYIVNCLRNEHINFQAIKPSCYILYPPPYLFLTRRGGKT